MNQNNINYIDIIESSIYLDNGAETGVGTGID